MKKILKITSILLIWAFMVTDFAFAQGSGFDNNGCSSVLSPRLSVNAVHFYNGYLNYYKELKIDIVLSRNVIQNKPIPIVKKDERVSIYFKALFFPVVIAVKSIKICFDFYLLLFPEKSILFKIKQCFDRKIKVLDIGTGDGVFVVRFQKLMDQSGIQAEISGIDKNPSSISLNKSDNPNILILDINNAESVYSKNSFDIIFINAPENGLKTQSLINQAMKFLSPEGFLILRLPKGVYYNVNFGEDYPQSLKEKLETDFNVELLEHHFLDLPTGSWDYLQKPILISHKIGNSEKAVSDVLAVIDSMLTLNKKAFNLGQKSINLNEKPLFPEDIQIKRPVLKDEYDPLNTKVELLGRTIKITDKDGQIIALKAQQKNEVDEAFKVEASFMKNDERISKKFFEVEVIEVSIEELRQLTRDEEFFEKAKVVDEKYIRLIRYAPDNNYFAYGEEQVQEIPQDQREQFVKDFIKHGINDIFYLLNTYSRAYIDILPIMHEPIKQEENKTGRMFSLEALPVGDIEEFKQACSHSNIRMGGLADFAPEHMQIFYKKADVFSIWFFSRYQLFQLMLKAANLSYKGRLSKEQMKEIFRFTYDQYFFQLRKLMKLDNISNNKQKTDKFKKQIEDMVDQLCFALEVCHDDKLFDIEEEFTDKPNGKRTYIEVRNWRWFRDDLGHYSSNFPAPALLELVREGVSDLLIEYIDENSSLAESQEKGHDQISPRYNGLRSLQVIEMSI